MKRPEWIWFVASRFLRSGRRNPLRFALPSAGIALGVMTLLVVIGIMNGFQMGFMNSVLELDSFHLRISAGAGLDSGEPGMARAMSLAERLRADPSVTAAAPFVDILSSATNADGMSAAIKIKVMPRMALGLDPGIARIAVSVAGSPVSGAGRGLVVGSEFADTLGIAPGDELEILCVKVSELEGVTAEAVKVPVAGIFKSGYYDYDAGLAFLAWEDAADIAGGEDVLVGVKLADRYADLGFESRLESRYGVPRARVESWREYNRVFFGALRTEKTVMMILIGLMFLVVGVNIFHAMRKSVHERMEDIAVLKAIGGGLRDIRLVFILDGIFIGAVGATAGLVIGLLVSMNINGVFSAVECVVNLFGTMVATVRGNGASSGFKVFSPDLFYLEDVPSNVPIAEAAFIFASGAFSAIAAAFAAAGRVVAFKPSEVLRNE